MSQLRMAILLSVSLAAALGACSQTPTAPARDSGANATSGYEAVLSEIEGLDRDARWDRLVELAKEEDGTFNVYATISGDEIGPLMEDFRETVGGGIDTTHYRAGDTTVLQRITEEARAGSPEADAVVSTGIMMEILSGDGYLQDFDTPVADEITKEVVHPDWAGVYINVYTAAWNTDLVDESETPTTWEEVLNYTGSPVGIEVKSYDWFATLVTKYFMEQQGLSREEAIQEFMDASSNLVPVDGRSGLTELTLAGQFDVAASVYTHNVEPFKKDGAPIEWEPPVEPLIQRPNGVAMMASSDMPATSLLFVDYMLSEAGQKVLSGFERVPTNVNVEGAIPAEYEVVTVDVADMVENREEWTDVYQRVTGDPAR